MKKQYRMFQVGESVTVIPSEQKMWLRLQINKGSCGPYTIAAVERSGCIYCAGHFQQLRMTDGTVASGKWFDENTPKNMTIPPVGCNSGGPDWLGDEYIQPAPHHQRAFDDEGFEAYVDDGGLETGE